MGYKLKRKDVKLCPNEELDITLSLEREERAAIHGIVVIDNVPVKDAVVKLFKKISHCCLEPVTFTFTDECGQFLFGVESNCEYVIKVFYYVPEHNCPQPHPYPHPKHGCDC